jgi:hypothetical protein
MCYRRIFHSLLIKIYGGSGFMSASGGVYMLLAIGSYGLRLAYIGSAPQCKYKGKWYAV